jgi:hypothetical protein
MADVMVLSDFLSFGSRTSLTSLQMYADVLKANPFSAAASFIRFSKAGGAVNETTIVFLPLRDACLFITGQYPVIFFSVKC